MTSKKAAERPKQTNSVEPGEGEEGTVFLLDIGNTHWVFGALEGDTLRHCFRLSTDPDRTADEYGALILPLLERLGLDPNFSQAFMVSSVVPPLNTVVEELTRNFFDVDATFVEPGIKTGLPIRYDNPAEVGADRIANAVAAREIYGSPVVVVDLGTATTFDLIDGSGSYVGGIIAPGLSLSAEALFSGASRLYRVALEKPPHLVGRNTAGAMQSGIYYGYVGLVDGILSRLEQDNPDLKAIVCTGGQAHWIAAASSYIDHVDEMLTLKGLRLIYERNRPRGRTAL